MLNGARNPDKMLCHAEGLVPRGRLVMVNLAWQKGHPSRCPNSLGSAVSLLPHFGQLMIIYHPILFPRPTLIQ